MIEKIKTIALIVAVIAAIVFGALYMHKQRQFDVAAQNVAALNDTIHSVKLLNGELLQSKKSLILGLKELREYTDIKESEVLEIQRKLDAKVQYIAKLEGEAKVENIVTKTDSVVIVDSTTHRYHFSDSTQYYDIKGTNTVDFTKDESVTVIDSLRMPVDLTVGLTKEDWTIFVKSSNPYVAFNNITGANLNKKDYLKRDRFSLSVGLDFGIQYNLIHKTFDVGPTFGLQVNYIIVSF